MTIRAVRPIGPLLIAAHDATDLCTVDVGALFVEHRRRLLGLATAIANDHALAEEVVQDAFVGLQRHAGRIENPVGYLQRSVVNQAITVECTVAHARIADGLLADAPTGIDSAVTLPQTTVAPAADSSAGMHSSIPEATTLTSFPSVDGACRGRGVGQSPGMQSDTAPQAFTIGVGDLVTTTGGSTSLAPPNIIIGAVTNKVSSASSWLLEIEPAADIDHLNEVSVVLYRPAE